jgi:LSD1 subclass zinc finger protein
VRRVALSNHHGGLACVVQYSPMVPKDLLEILVCPACKTELEYRQSPESLKCKQCHRVYAVKDDIPIMLIDEATIEA